jgi:glucose-6-phosphate 1-dehydrogenase
VVFGITGDLARKLTFRSLYRLDRRELLSCPVIGVAADDLRPSSSASGRGSRSRRAARRSTSRCSRGSSERLEYVGGDFGDDQTYVLLAETLGDRHNPTFYPGGDPNVLKDAKSAVFRAIAEAEPAQYVRGQYEGYREIDGVAPDSTTET